jgi:hypothetical protein
MPNMIKRFKGIFVFLMLFTVSARVFTGASEAQVNFTSLIVDQHIAQSTKINHESLLHQAVLSSSENASSIPDKHRTYATYKKYVTPDKSFAVTLTQSREVSNQFSALSYVAESHNHAPIFLPLANSPPVVVSARSLTHTTTTGSSVVLEKDFGINKDSHNWEFYSL